MINIITVGYNEKINLPKLFKSLEYLKSKIKIRHIYIDQNSNDNSVSIAKQYGCDIYIHENKGYADPDKKWAIENLLNDDDWCLILDCDEELTFQLSDEINNSIKENLHNIYSIKLSTHFLGIINGTFIQTRLFRKKFMIVTDEIHIYLKPKENKIGILKSPLINNDLKTYGSEITSLIKKQTQYAKNEIEKFNNISQIQIKINLFWKPILRFFGWGIRHKLFFKGIPGFIYCFYMAFYQFTIYAYLLEKSQNKNSIFSSK